LISVVTTYNSNVQISTTNIKTTRHTKETGKYDMTQRKNNNSVGTIHKKGQMSDFLDKDFKTAVLKMLKELKDLDNI
jgi:hypothetical protein